MCALDPWQHLLFLRFVQQLSPQSSGPYNGYTTRRDAYPSGFDMHATTLLAGSPTRDDGTRECQYWTPIVDACESNSNWELIKVRVGSARTTTLQRTISNFEFTTYSVYRSLYEQTSMRYLLCRGFY